MRPIHLLLTVTKYRVGDRLLGYSSKFERWAVFEATEPCPEDLSTFHFSLVGQLPKCEINPRAWDVFIFQ